jgi:hypothetical protein
VLALAKAGDATVKRYNDDRHGQLRGHLANFVSAYNFVRRLKTLRGLRCRHLA